jgi:hypothetical protein
MTIEELNKWVDDKRSVSIGWPRDIIYKAIDEANAVKVIISTTNTASKGVLKRIDPWGFAFLNEVKNITGNKLIEMKFCIHLSKEALQYEALKRRLSYLAIANDLTITLEKNSSPDSLYNEKTLRKRPDSEVVRGSFKPRGDKDKAGRLEKDFQTYLYGKGLHDSEKKRDRTNERLALLGPDFVRIAKKCYKVEREFPTGVFDKKLGENNRLLPTEYVDLVSINRNGNLSIIELKFDDPKLEVISQVLNYALFFHSYRSQLTSLVDEKLSYSTKKCKLVTYLVSNTFHKKFDIVFPYYAKGPLVMKQVFMGYMPSSEKK